MLGQMITIYMRLLLTLCAACLLFVTAGAQQSIQKSAPPNEPLVIVDAFKTTLKELVLAPENIASIYVFKDTSATNRFGDAGKNGALLINTKPNTNLLRLNSLLDKFQVADSVRNYRICINEVPIAHPELILVDESQITGVHTVNDIEWNPAGANKNEKLLNIVSKAKQ